MLNFPTLETLQSYRNHPGLSQSFLKKVLANDTREMKQTVPMIIGSLLDAKLTSPNLVNDLYHRGIVKRPSDAIKGFIDELYAKEIDLQEREGTRIYDFEQYKEYLIFAAREANYQPRWGDDAVWNSILKEGKDYWKELVEAQGRILVTEEEWNTTDAVASMTMSHELTGKYFIDQKKVGIYYQQPLYGKEEAGDLLKGLADLIVVEHETKTIYLIDIKASTVKGIQEWMNICRQKSYPFQMSFYHFLLKQNLEQFGAQDYKILCRWIVIPYSTEYFRPWVIPCSHELLQVGKYGYSVVKDVNILGKAVSYATSPYREGWRSALSVYRRSQELNINDYDVKWHLQHGKLSESETESLFFS